MELFRRLKPIEEGIEYFYRRSEVIQSNIANADTPFYKPKELLFERELREEIRLKKTDPRHIEPEPQRGVKFKEITLDDVSGYDGNRVNLDKELAKLAETAIMARTLNEVLRKEVGKLKLVMGGR
ncbi:flagellar basal body rod protein FlgB [Thermovibrio sp.]